MHVGDVIRIFAEDSIPPRVKYIVVVGVTPETLATVFINSEPRPQYLSAPLQSLQVSVTPEHCPVLDYESYADCSDMKERSKSEINTLIQKEPGRNHGQLPQPKTDMIVAAVRRARSIAVGLKKKYNLV